VRVREFGYTFCRPLVTLAAIALKADIIQKEADPVAAWARHIKGKALRIDLTLARKDSDPAYTGLDYLGCAAVQLTFLEGLRPGVADAVRSQTRGSKGDAIPIAFITHTDGLLSDLTTITFSFDINDAVPYPPDATVEQAERQLRAFMRFKQEKSGLDFSHIQC
jgi:hypothetical protein